MKIIYLSSALLPNPWANSYQTVKTSEALSRLGVDIELWARGKTGLQEILEIYGLSSVSFLRLVKRNIRSQVALRQNHLSYSFTLLRRLRGLPRHGLALYSRETSLWLVLLWAKFFWRVPYVFELHRERSLSWHDALRRALLIRFSDGLVVISKELLNRFAALKKNLGLAFCGVDSKRFENIPNQEESRRRYSLPNFFYLGYAGGFEEYQGLPTLLAAFEKISPELPGVGLFIAGGSKPEINGLAVKISPALKAKVFFLGRLPFSDVPSALAAADILVMPFENMDAGGSPVKMFEYLFMKKPIVASRTPMITEVLRDGENALLFKVGNPFHMAEKIRILINNTEKRAHLAERAFQDSGRYTFDARASAIQSVINKI